MSMSPLYHGLSIADAAGWVGVTEDTIRKWLQRGHIQRTPDGRIDPFTLEEWAATKRDQGKARRTGIHAAGQPRWDRRPA